MKKILVPTDFSENADNALHLVAQLAEKAEVEIVLLNVINPENFYTTNETGEFLDASADENYRNHLKEKSQNRLQELANDYPALKSSIKVEFGKVTDIINQCVEKEEADSVVIGRHSASIYEDMIFGTNAESIIRTVHCPVLNVRGRIDDFKMDKVAFATNLQDDLGKVISQINVLKSLFQANVHLTYVNTPADFFNTRRINEMKDEFIAKYPIEFSEFYIYDDFTIETGITHFAEDIDADVIALAAPHFNGLVEYMGNTRISDVVMDETERPVLTFSI